MPVKKTKDAAADTAASSATSKYTIVVAEDDKFLMRAMSDKLKREGFTVVQAGNGVEALEQIRKTRPHLVLLDLIMPVKDGFSVLADVQMDPAIAKIPIIVLSNLGQESDMQKTKELGAAGYFIKAELPLKQLVDVVKQQLARAA